MPDGMKDPRAILGLLSQRNGLDGLADWHMKLHFEQLDEKGGTTHSGTIEEFYAGPTRYRIVFVGDDFHQTEVATDAGLFWSGDDKWPPYGPWEALTAEVQPLRLAFVRPEEMQAGKTNRKSGQLELTCIELTSRHGWKAYDRQYCAGRDSAILRVIGSTNNEIAYNRIALFRGRFFAQEIEFAWGKKVKERVNVDLLESLTDPVPSLFARTSGMALLPARIEVPGAVLEDECGLSSPHPPNIHGASGAVTVDFVVGTDGKVIEANAIKGSKSLGSEVSDMIRALRFQPFRVLGKAVEVESKLTMQFNSF